MYRLAEQTGNKREAQTPGEESFMEYQAAWNGFQSPEGGDCPFCYSGRVGEKLAVKHKNQNTLSTSLSHFPQTWNSPPSKQAVYLTH